MTALLNCPVPKVSAVTLHWSQSHVLASYCIRSSLIAASVGEAAPLFGKILASKAKEVRSQEQQVLPASLVIALCGLDTRLQVSYVNNRQGPCCSKIAERTVHVERHGGMNSEQFAEFESQLPPLGSVPNLELFAKRLR